MDPVFIGTNRLVLLPICGEELTIPFVLVPIAESREKSLFNDFIGTNRSETEGEEKPTKHSVIGTNRQRPTEKVEKKSS